MELVIQFYLQKLSLALVLFGCVVLLGIGFSGTNVIEEVNMLFLDGLGFVIYFLIAVSTVYNMLQRDFYLPFLGHTVYPCNVLTPKEPLDASLSVTVTDLTPSVNIVYWASEVVDPSQPEKIIDNPWDAYDKYSNSGVTLTDEDGTCVLKIRKPSQYRVPSGFKLKKHVHFRECIGNGMLGPVRTKNI